MLAAAPNFRDLGGHVTRDGRMVRTGIAFRSDQLHALPVADLQVVERLALAGVFDLRSPDEARARPDSLPAGVPLVAVDVLADAQLGGLDGFERLMRAPSEANAMLGDGKIDAVLERVYRGLVSLPSATRGFGRLFRSMAEPGGLPVLFHCATGKDRTGWAAAALLSLLGVERSAVEADYLRSNDHILPKFRPAIDRFAAGGGDPRILESLFGVRPSWLDAAFDEVARVHGTVERYFSEALGVEPAGQERLKTAFLEPLP